MARACSSGEVCIEVSNFEFLKQAFTEGERWPVTRVVVHPTSRLTGAMIQEMYGGDVRMVRHSDVICRREHVHE